MFHDIVWLFVAFYFSFLFTVCVLAAFNLEFGARRLWVHALIKVFEWGKKRVKLYERKRSISSGSDIEDEDDDSKPSSPSHGIHIEGEGSRQFHISDITYFVKNGIEAIIEDQVTGRFSAVELPTWNLLTRTNTHPQFISWRLSLLWAIGGFIRYVILLPFRFGLACTALSSIAFWSFVIGQFPKGRIKRLCIRHMSQTCYRIMARSFSAIATFHNIENRANGGGVCVSNHTSVLDTIILGCDNTYAMVGQAAGGFMGFMQRSFSKAESHVWFQRSEIKDRQAVARRMRDHIEDSTKLPILIFPEGTCINNTSIMMFKKGGFEVGGTVYPCAIKYDSRFADAFWNSSKYSLLQHFFMVMTSWALVVDIWYLPPVTQQDGENPVDFANRVKHDIAKQGGLVDLEWDGGVKRTKPKDSLREKAQENYARKVIKGE